jgi:hypothetical protein
MLEETDMPLGGAPLSRDAIPALLGPATVKPRKKKATKRKKKGK